MNDDKKKWNDMVEFMNQPVRNSVGDEPPVGPPEYDELSDLVRCIVQAADGRKAENIVALRVSKVTTLTSFLVIVSGNSRPQNQAISTAIQKDLLELYQMRPGANGVAEGTPDSGWILLDYGSVMVHIMTPKSRLYYNVEGQWRDKGGEYMDLSKIILPNTVDGSERSQVGGTNRNLSQDDDPFWS